MHFAVPSPFVLPVTVGADLHEADQGPSRPHKDTVHVVLRIVVLSFFDNEGACAIRGECLSKLQEVRAVGRQLWVVGVPGGDQAQFCVERDDI